MVYRKKSRRTYRSRRPRYTRKRKFVRKRTNRYHKHGRANPMRARVTRVKGTGISDVVWQKFRYAENNYQFNLGTVDYLATFPIHLNDPFDPYGSTGGKSALYFQQACSMYKYCRTYGASITVRLTDVVAANLTPMLVAIYLNSNFNADFGTPNIDTILAMPRNRCRIMKIYPNRIGGTRTLKFFAHISDVFYMTRSQYDNMVPGPDFDVTNFGGFLSPVYKAIANVLFFKINDQDLVETELLGDITVVYYTKMWCRQAFQEPGDDQGNDITILGSIPPAPLAASTFDDIESIEEEYPTTEEWHEEISKI